MIRRIRRATARGLHRVSEIAFWSAVGLLITGAAVLLLNKPAAVVLLVAGLGSAAVCAAAGVAALTVRPKPSLRPARILRTPQILREAAGNSPTR
jgi:hypothetical protein